MNGKTWLNCFEQVINSKRQQSSLGTTPNDSDWTEFMQEVMDTVGQRIGCVITRRRTQDPARSGEYLNIDAFFVDDKASNSKNKSGYDPFVLPRAVVELENSYDIDKISYCLWKILCVRSPIRVMICYQSNTRKIERLRQHLEKVILDGKLMKGAKGDLLVIIGDESAKWHPNSYFKDFFSVFVWVNDKLGEYVP